MINKYIEEEFWVQDNKIDQLENSSQPNLTGGFLTRVDLLGGVVVTGVDGGVTNEGDSGIVGCATGCDGLGVGVCCSGTFTTGSGLLKTGSGF